MKKTLIALLLSLLPVAASAQAIQQSGSVTPTHIPYWVTNGVQADGGTASDSPITSFGVTSNTSAGICVSSGRVTAAGRQQLCLGAPLTSNAKITLQNYGTATAQGLDFVINGTTVSLPTGGGNTIPTITTPLTSGARVCANGTSGALVGCTGGVQYGVSYWSTANVVSATAAGTNGQVFLATTGAAPAFVSLGGDVSAVTSGGAVTIGKVNGVAFPATPSVGAAPYVSGSNTITYGAIPVTGGGTGAATLTAHGVLVGESTSPITSVTSTNIGYCLLSQGLGSDPVWAPCSTGSGTAAGPSGSVQYNASSSLAGDANLAWSSPALTIGTAATTTGQLKLQNGGASGTAVTIQNNAATSAYNFNLPATAGTSGQPLLSGGGAATAMTFGTLGIGGGGTNCSSASGTCLDNITGFASTGYINRTGAGSYTFSAAIPVSGGGTGLASGTSGGIPGFTASGTITSSALLTQYGPIYGGGAGATPVAMAAGTDGQLIVGQTSAAPLWKTASGDLTVAATGAFTVAKLNGVAYAAGPATGTMAYISASNTATYSATPTLGAAASATGKINLVGTTSGTVTIAPQDAAGTYNFNLPTSAGTSGQPLLSAGGGSSAMTFGTLSVGAGGTGQTSLSAHTVIVGNATSSVTQVGPGAVGTVLQAAGASADPSFVATPILGVAGTTAGTLRLSGLTSGVVTVATADVAGTWTMKLPTSGGTSGYVLQTDGTGVTSWINPSSGGTMTSVTFSKFLTADNNPCTTSCTANANSLGFTHASMAGAL